MLLSHELGHEVGRDETMRRAIVLCKHIREQDNKDATVYHALIYMRSILEKMYNAKFS